MLNEKTRDEKQRFSIRKLSIGAASVLVGLAFSAYSGQTVLADTTSDSQVTSAKTQDDKDKKAEQEDSTNENSKVTKTTASQEEKSNADQKSDAVGEASKDQNSKESSSTAVKGKEVETAKTTETGSQIQNGEVQNRPQGEQQNQNSGEGTQTNFTLHKGTVIKAEAMKQSLAAKTQADDTTSIIVTDAQGLIDAIQKGTYTTINIDGDINLGEKTSSNYTNTTINNKRNIVIQATGDKKTIDFAGYGFNMYSNDYGVTFKNLNLYGQSYFGIFRSAGSYTFDNVDYTGSQLVYTDSGYNTTVNFEGNVSSHSVGSYTSPLGNKTRSSQGGNNQQVLQFAAGNNEINFAAGSKVNFTTTNSNVIEIDKGTTVINVKSNPDGSNGAQVTLNPHTQNGPEQLNGMNMDGIARGIASNGNTTLNIDKGANLDIVLKDDAADKYHSSALFLNSGATINDKGSLTVTSVGQPYYRSSGIDAPVYINGNSTINVEGGNFTVNATDLGDYQGNIVTSSGTSTININHHGTFDVTGDGTKATAVSLGSGSTFTSTQPELFSIDMPEGATAIKNGKVSFKGVKTSENGQPIGEIDVTYAADGTPTVTKVTSADRQTVIDTKAAGDAAKNKINLLAAGKEVELTNITFNKDANGDYIMAGNANTADGDGAYVYININGSETPVKVTGSGSQTIYSITNTEKEPTATEVPYTVQTGADGKFSVNLGQLKDTDTVSVHADKDFVTSDTDTKTVSEWMLNSYKQQLQDLINEAPTVEGSKNYTAADTDKQTAYTDAITGGSNLLADTSATTEQVQNQITAITNAKKALNGDSNVTDAKNAIQNALDAKKAAITAATNIDQTEKDKLINDAETAATNANTAIDQATTKDAINTAKTTGIESINNVTILSLDSAKTDAKAAVQEALTKKLTEINNAQNIDQTTKDKLTADANQAATDANTAIDNATTNDIATKAGQDGVDAINKVTVPSVTDSQNAAKDAVQKALDAKKAEINNATNIDQAEKDKLTKDAEDAADTANKAIDQATTADAIKKAQDDGTDNINNVKVPSLEDAKNEATKVVEDALTKQTDLINNSNNLSSAEKEDLVKQATDAANAAKDKINAATTNDEAAKAGQDGVDAIEKVVPTSLDKAKADAKAAVQEALTKKLTEINNAQNIDQATKDKLTADANQAATDANTAIDAAKTNDIAAKAGQDGVDAINKVTVPSVTDSQNAAKDAVQKALDAKKTEINNATNIDQAEKDKLIKDAEDAADTANKAIDQATTADEIKKAQDDGTTNINNVKVPSLEDAKNEATKAVDAALTKQTDLINKASNLSDKEKQDLISQATDAANAAKDKINAATTNNEAAKAGQDGVATIEKVVPTSLEDAKNAANKAVDDELTNKLDEINKAADLTTDEKAALTKEANDDAAAAKEAISKATTNDAATEAGQDGVKKIDGIPVPEKSPVKTKAETDLNNAVTEAKNAIDQDTNLTDEQKQAAKDQIDANAKTAQDAINNAKTNADVTNAVDNGKLAIDKNVANAVIDNAAAGKLKEIKVPLTTDEQKTYTDLINSEANNAKQNIANATTPEEVTTAQNNGVNEINGTNIPTTSKVKEDALNAIKTALDNKTKEINDSQNINAQEKADLIKQAQDAADTANNNINNATTNAAVETAQTNGEKAIADVTVPNLSDVKKQNIDLVNKALDAKKDEIDKASNLSNDEKQKLVNEATNAATDAINNINAAKTNDEAKEAANTGVQNIENVTIPSLDDAKKNAKQAIDDTLKSKVDEINKASNLNPTEKQDLIDKATDAANTAKTNVDKATTNDEAKEAADEGIQTIKGITFTSLDDAKKAANTAIDNALTAKKNEIDAANNLSDTEKQKLVDEATQAANTAKENISKAQTNDAVTEAQNKGTEAIANVNVPSLDQAKKAAINAIKQVQEAKNAQIAKAANLSADEQKALTDQVNEIANDAIAEINKPTTTTNDAVAATRDDAIKQITDLFIPTLSSAQKDARDAIESAKNAKIDDINNATHLTDEEKQDLIDQTTKAAKDATDAINAADTNDAVKDAETAGLNNINKVTIPSLADKQQAAIKELDAARDAKVKTIDESTDLTTDEKNALKDKVQNAYSNAVENVTKAATDQAVTEAKDNGIKAINSIEVPAKSADKEKAKTDLTDAVNKAKEAIDQDSNLTDEEKQAAKDQIDQDAKNAEDAIEKAKTDADVTKAANDGKLAIDKDVANAAIDNAAAARKDAISKAPDLTKEEKTALDNEVDQRAKAAKDAINVATTEPAVESAKDKGIEAINGVEIPTKSQTKTDAETDIDKAAEDAKKAIDNTPDLTDDQKQAAKDQIDQDAKNAKDAIDKAADDKDVKDATDAGLLAINKVTAKAAIDSAAAAKKNEIAKAPLTTDEAKTLNDLVDQEANAAKNNIDNATTTDAVENAKNTGVKAINDINVPSTSPAKDQANKDIQNALDNKTKEINDAKNLSNDEKADLIKKAQDAANEAKENIAKATTDADVTKAAEDGVQKIADVKVPTLEDAKKDATDLIDNALKQKQEEINNADNLTPDEKADLNKKAEDEAAKAKDAIEKATTNDDVDKARNEGAQKIADIKVPSLDDKKNDANKAIDDVLKEKTEEINKAPNLSDQEKADLVKEATDKANTAKDAIEKATNDDEVAKAEEKGISDILNVKIPGLDDHKKNAVAALDAAKADKLAEINKASNLTSDEKTALTNKVNSEYNNAIENVNNAKTNDAVDVARDAGVTAILNIKVPTIEETKKDSVDALNQVRDAKKEQIKNATNLSQDEKDKLTKQVDEIADNAINNINKATNDQAAKDAEKQGIEDILNIKVPTLDEVKTNAKQAIDDALQSKTNEINNATNLDPATKKTLIDEATNAANTAKANIDAATTNDEALSVQKAGVDKILGIKVPTLDEALDKALTSINDALKNKLAEINNATYLPQSQRDDLAKQANAAAQKAIEAVNAAKTNAEAASAAQKGVEAINNIVVPGQIIDNGGDNTGNDAQAALNNAKSQADQAIDQALANKTAQINAASQLSDAQKADLINQANQIAAQAKENIAKATTQGEVNLAMNNGVAEINAIAIPSLSDAKADAISDIDKAASAKNAEINRANLSAKQKQALRAELAAAVANAKAAIEAANTLQAVADAKASGIAAIEAIIVSAKAANEELANANSAYNAGLRANGANSANANNQANTNADHKKQLPQTGKASDVQIALAGAAAAMTGLISLLGAGKKRKDN